MKYLVINDAGTVTNVIVWDGSSPYQPEPGHRLELLDLHPAGVWIGWQLTNGTWQAPPDPTPA